MADTKTKAPAETKAPEPKTAGKKPENMNLEEKFVELRKAVPAIVQKKHSDGVKYKFAKIFDVYELLTPAMNEYGVNFDVVKEEATRHDELGNALYYHNYQQQTQKGMRTVWVYEADLTLRWTNVHNPEEKQEITLHALGTNDGGPDKAKGSAWTYCLKYYLFEKFGIDQGEDDPDNNDLSGTTEPTFWGSSGSGGRNTPPNNQNGQNGPKKLSDAQLNRMYKLGAAAGRTQEQIDKRIAEKYGHQDPHDLTRAQYDEICDALTASTPTEGQTNA